MKIHSFLNDRLLFLEESLLLPAIQYLRHTLFKRLVDNVLEESPLDLSTSLVMSKVAAVANLAASAVSPSKNLVLKGFKKIQLLLFLNNKISPL